MNIEQYRTVLRKCGPIVHPTEAAELLQVSRQRVYQMIGLRQLQGIRLDGRHYVGYRSVLIRVRGRNPLLWEPVKIG